jgi:hypothetical protein
MPAGERRPTHGLHPIYRQTGRHADAIRVLEQGLPFPGAFKELVTLYRAFAKAAKQAGNEAERAEHYRRMFSLSKIYHTAMTLRLPNQPVSVDRPRAARWIDQIRATCGTVYAYDFDGQRIEEDSLLTASDYKALTTCANLGRPDA